jgi:diguanylate cyclase (GGDEF)-like protein
VTEQHELEEQLKHRAFHDALTGLPNRVLFQDRITQAATLTARTGLITGILFIDLDDFKLVNDTMGHGVGDELLVAVAGRLTGLARDSDAPARLGGHEFAVLVANAVDETAVEAAAERMVHAFAEPFPLSTGLVTITVTVGISTTLDSSNTDELLRHADLALYAAKAAGKRQWRRYQPVLSVGLTRRREMQEALEDATARGVFTLAYQPIVALGTGKLAGFEALIRWPHPEWGMLLPGQFIGLAEETSQIIAIGSWVLEHAAADLTQWLGETVPPCPGLGGPADAGHRDLYVSVNVSARQFASPGFAGSVRQVLASTGLAPAALMLELTESALLQRDERLLGDLAALRATGVRLALDDFGTGYSSLSYLAELPVDVVKMDRSFVEGIATSGQRLTLAEGIVQIAANLGFEVIAEGIETQIQRDLLASIGCGYGQGYLLAMPMTASQAAELARTGFPEPAPTGTGR